MTEDRKPLPSISLQEVEENKEKMKLEREKSAREARERQERESALRDWIRDGGDKEGFVTAWPGLRDRMRADRVARQQEQARQDLACSYRQNF